MKTTEKKINRIHLKVTPSEHELIHSLALKYCSGNISAFIRMRCLGLLKPEILTVGKI